MLQTPKHVRYNHVFRLCWTSVLRHASLIHSFFTNVRSLGAPAACRNVWWPPSSNRSPCRACVASPSSRTWHKKHMIQNQRLTHVRGCGCGSTPTAFTPPPPSLRLHFSNAAIAPAPANKLHHGQLRLASRNAILFRQRIVQPDLGNAHRRQLCACSKKVVVIKSMLCKASQWSVWRYDLLYI